MNLLAKDALLATSNKFQTSKALKHVFKLAQTEEFQELIKKAAADITWENTCAIKTQLSLDLQVEFPPTIEEESFHNSIFSRGSNNEFEKSFAATYHHFADPVRPVVVLAQIHMINQWALKYYGEEKMPSPPEYIKKFLSSSGVEECMKDVTKIFTVHHEALVEAPSRPQPSKNVMMMLVGPCGVGKSVLDTLAVAYITSLHLPITTTTTPYSHNPSSHPFGSWSIDNYEKNGTITITTSKDVKTSYQQYTNDLQSHFKSFTTSRIFVTDPSECLNMDQPNEALDFFNTMYRELKDPPTDVSAQSLFFSVHSIPCIIDPEGVPKADSPTIWHTFPNFTFLNMPFTHSTMYKIFSTFVQNSHEKHNLLRQMYLHCAPTFRNYLTVFSNTKKIVGLKDIISFNPDTLSKYHLKFSTKRNTGEVKKKIPKYIEQSFLHNYNPDLQASSPFVDPLGASTYVSPFLRLGHIESESDKLIPVLRGGTEEEVILMNTINLALEYQLEPKWVTNQVEIKYTNNPTLPNDTEMKPYYVQLHPTDANQINARQFQLFSNILEPWKEACFHHLPRNFPAADMVFTYTADEQKHVRFIQVKKDEKQCDNSTKFQAEATCQILVASANFTKSEWSQLFNEFPLLTSSTKSEKEQKAQQQENYQNQIISQLNSVKLSSTKQKYMYDGYEFYAAISIKPGVIDGQRPLTALSLDIETILDKMAEKINLKPIPNTEDTTNTATATTTTNTSSTSNPSTSNSPLSSSEAHAEKE